MSQRCWFAVNLVSMTKPVVQKEGVFSVWEGKLPTSFMSTKESQKPPGMAQ
jgi:hypothetical protein